VRGGFSRLWDRKFEEAGGALDVAGRWWNENVF